MVRMQHIGHGIYSWGPVRSVTEYQELYEQWEKLQRLEIEDASKRELSSALQEFATGYLTRQIRMQDDNAFTTFRASRPTSVQRSETWATLNDIWAPQAKFVKEFGRFN